MILIIILVIEHRMIHEETAGNSLNKDLEVVHFDIC